MKVRKRKLSRNRNFLAHLSDEEIEQLEEEESLLNLRRKRTYQGDNKQLVADREYPYETK